MKLNEYYSIALGSDSLIEEYELKEETKTLKESLKEDINPETGFDENSNYEVRSCFYDENREPEYHEFENFDDAVEEVKKQLARTDEVDEVVLWDIEEEDAIFDISTKEKFMTAPCGPGANGDIWYIGYNEDDARNFVNQAYPDWIKYGMSGDDTFPYVLQLTLNATLNELQLFDDIARELENVDINNEDAYYKAIDNVLSKYNDEIRDLDLFNEESGSWEIIYDADELRQNAEDELEDYDPDMDKSLTEDTVKQGKKWVNKGSEGTHGKFNTKKEADAQRKAMFANGYKGESLEEAKADLTKGYKYFINGKEITENEYDNYLLDDAIDNGQPESAARRIAKENREDACENGSNTWIILDGSELTVLCESLTEAKKESLTEDQDGDQDEKEEKADQLLDKLIAETGNEDYYDADGYWESDTKWCYRYLYQIPKFNNKEKLEQLVNEYSKEIPGVEFYYADPDFYEDIDFEDPNFNEDDIFWGDTALPGEIGYTITEDEIDESLNEGMFDRVFYNTQEIIDNTTGKNKAFISRIAKHQEEKYGNVDIFDASLKYGEVRIGFGDYSLTFFFDNEGNIKDVTGNGQGKYQASLGDVAKELYKKFEIENGFLGEE